MTKQNPHRIIYEAFAGFWLAEALACGIAKIGA
jgi:hypothetical protein